MSINAAQRDWIERALGVAVAAAPPGAATPGGAPSGGDGNTDGVGADPADMDGFLDAALKAKHWEEAAQILNGYPAPALDARLAKHPRAVAKLHAAALAAQSLGASSPVALATEKLAHTTMGREQSSRADALEQKLSPQDAEKYHALLDAANSPEEKQFITKGLAANHSVAELAAFAQKIAGKDAKWLQDNLSLTGDSSGSGIKQQWHDSCGPTTYEAVLGEMDPLYALKKHEDNAKLTTADDSDGMKANPDMAAEQKKILVDAHGVATNRNTQGVGMWMGDKLNSVSATTGLKYETKVMANALEFEEGMKVLNAATAAHRPVPIVIGNFVGDTHHYVLVTASDPGPPRYYKIHDPWAGKTVTRSEEQFRKGQLGIDGMNMMAAYHKPVPVQPAGPS